LRAPGAWLQNAAPRLHRNKLATALANNLARIAWSVLRNENTFDARHQMMAICPPSSRQRKSMERFNERIQSLVTQLVAHQPVR
jgi:hypothetical protein